MPRQQAPEERIAKLEKLLGDALPFVKIASDALDRSGEYRYSDKASAVASRIQRALPKAQPAEKVRE